ncbi:uncharacterized protein MYCFIDRAFT_89874 [Pseudocercospora fijiensis CIRAD86]|uniref:HCNGP-like protein n=1 Tax=Pseudocercospora fijiensis (strain CIRAD86) TaxID=383855 RepID=M3ARZ9_PSEFD|nr:uncharacterized protein MYCFIDRAFT_89874 [Pseudocercospora fijiensis CIRAD86]EME80232.1 hypothetical protein MYCFIDRAFT_89874 [Pseudocercospora fijiensis CIRAD86]
MNGLVAYGSSDEEDDIQPEKPAKIAKIDPGAAPTASQEDANHQPAAINTPTADISPSGPAPGPSAPPDASNIAEHDSEPPLSPYTYERQRLRELTMPTVPNFDIPNSPLPPARNSEEAAALAATTKKFEKFLELKKKGLHFNERLQNSSSLRNPSLLPKLMKFAGISQEDSHRSSLPEGLGVAVRWPEECYVETLMKQNERREKKQARAPGDKIDFVPAKSTGSTPGDAPRKSKFDKR